MSDSLLDPMLAVAFDELETRHEVALPTDTALAIQIVGHHRRRQRVRRVAVATGTALAVAAAGVLVFRQVGVVNVDDHASPNPNADAIARTDAHESSTPAPAETDLHREGSLFAGTRRLPASEPIPMGEWLHTLQQPACTDVPSHGRICLDADTKIRVVASLERTGTGDTSETPLELELAAGRLTVASSTLGAEEASTASDDAASTWRNSVVHTPFGDVRGSEGEYSVELTTELLNVYVAVGGVQISRPQGEFVHLRRGERIELVPPATTRSPDPVPRRAATKSRSRSATKSHDEHPPVHVPTAAELGRAAAKQLRLRNYAAAAELYDDLAQRFGDDDTGRRALVALGQLRLDRLGQPRQALAAFERYLATSDRSVAQEAEYGKIRCLTALKRPEQAHQAIEAFLSKYPQSAHSSQLRRRLADGTAGTNP